MREEKQERKRIPIRTRGEGSDGTLAQVGAARSKSDLPAIDRVQPTADSLFLAPFLLLICTVKTLSIGKEPKEFASWQMHAMEMQPPDANGANLHSSVCLRCCIPRTPQVLARLQSLQLHLPLRSTPSSHTHSHSFSFTPQLRRCASPSLRVQPCCRP